MAQSADYISFDSEIPSPEVEDDMVAPSCGKIHEAIEVGDDYNSEEDPTSSPATAEGVQDLSDRAALHSNSKRPAESQSLGSNLPEDAKRQKLRAAPKEKSLALLLPDKFWVDIFSQLHPHTLGQVRRTCQLFYKHLQNEVIWKTSRKRFMPEMPKPVFNLKEWEMLALAKGEGCMLCNAKLPTRSVYWAFRIRCCSQCLQKNTTKETAIPDPPPFPPALLYALPYGMLDTSDEWVPNIHSSRPITGFTKLYWNADIESIRERYDEAKAMCAQEEWLKGLESEGQTNKVDVARMESFESRWSAQRKAKLIGSTPKTSVSTHIEGRGNAQRGPIPNTWAHQQNTAMQSNLPSHQHPIHSHQHGHPSQPPTMQINYVHNGPHLNGQIMMFSGQHGQPGIGGQWQGIHSQGPPAPTNQQLHPQLRLNNIRTERSAVEVAEVRARRRQDIEDRCLQLNPPLYPNVLHHMPAFKATMVIAFPFTDQAWENLRPKLLEQRVEAEEEERKKQNDQMRAQKQVEEKRAQNHLQKEIKDRREKEWDELQVPLKEKLGQYADEAVNTWRSQNRTINQDTVAQLASDVLIHTRRRFYEESPFLPEDPYHTTSLDPTNPQGANELEVPTDRRLLLENMKYIFDTKVKPITDQFRKELFLCSGCGNNPKFYGFEGVIQHYAAKHTNTMSLGSVIVHWKSDWPYQPPFVSNPQSKPKNPQYAHHQRPVISMSSSNHYSAYNSMHPSTPQTEVPSRIMGLNNTYGGFDDRNHPNGIYQSYAAQQTILNNLSAQTSGPVHNENIPLNQKQPNQQSQSESHRQHCGEIAATAREAWFQLNGIKDLPSSVRVYYVIRKVVKSFQAKFSPLIPQLGMFIEALREQSLMKPMRNVNGLQCLACTINPPHNSAAPGRVFTLTSLIQHFEMVHVNRNRGPMKFDWKTQMIRLPEPRAIGLLRDAQGMDQEKLRLLKEVFPVGFNLPLPMPLGKADIPSGPSSSSLATVVTPDQVSVAALSIASPAKIPDEGPQTVEVEMEKQPVVESRESSEKLAAAAAALQSAAIQSAGQAINDRLYRAMEEYRNNMAQGGSRSSRTQNSDSRSGSAEVKTESSSTRSKKDSMTAAERFLATFLQDDDLMDGLSGSGGKESPTTSMSDENAKNAGVRTPSDTSSKSVEQEAAPARESKVRLESRSLQSRDKESKQYGSSTNPIDMTEHSSVAASDDYNQQRTSKWNRETYDYGGRPPYPNYSHRMSISPEPEDSFNGLGDDTKEQGRDREAYAHQQQREYSPRQRSRSPQLSSRYPPPPQLQNPVQQPQSPHINPPEIHNPQTHERYYNSREYRMDAYSRVPGHPELEYVPGHYRYRSRSKSPTRPQHSTQPGSQKPTSRQEGRYYEPFYDHDPRYVIDERPARQRMRSRTPPPSQTRPSQQDISKERRYTYPPPCKPYNKNPEQQHSSDSQQQQYDPTTYQQRGRSRSPSRRVHPGTSSRYLARLPSPQLLAMSSRGYYSKQEEDYLDRRNRERERDRDNREKDNRDKERERERREVAHNEEREREREYYDYHYHRQQQHYNHLQSQQQGAPASADASGGYDPEHDERPGSVAKSTGATDPNGGAEGGGEELDGCQG